MTIENFVLQNPASMGDNLFLEISSEEKRVRLGEVAGVEYICNVKKQESNSILTITRHFNLEGDLDNFHKALEEFKQSA
ncbi:MAG: hypothetical protein V1914_02330 [archaeon]